MKKALLLLLCISAAVVTAQEGKRTQELAPFNELKVFDGLRVSLVRGNSNRAVISGSNTQKVAVVNQEGTLHLRMEMDKLFSGYRTEITLYYAQNLNVVDVNEDASITSSVPMKQEVLDLRAQEGGELQLPVQVDQLLIKCVTGGKIQAKGTAKVQDVNINTGGIYDGKEVHTGFSTVSVNAGSRAEIFATDYVKATVRAGGEVQVYGDPKKMDEKTVFGGTVKRM